MMILNKQWCYFLIDDLFNVIIGKSIDGNKIADNLGSTPYITRRVTNNGLDNFIDDYPEEYLFKDVPVITIGNETAKPFVQTNPFYTGTKVNIMIPKFKYKNWNVLMFICRCLEKATQRYTYSYTINSTRLKKLIIKLPVDDNGNPDWQFMEKYIQELKNKIEFNSIPTTKKEAKLGLKELKWSEFKFSEVFEYERGKRYKRADHIEGDIIYVSSSSKNNGVDAYITPNEGMYIYKNKLTLANSGSVGYCFYHPYEFVASDHVMVIWIKEHELTKNIALFLKPIFEKIKYRYSFAREINKDRLMNEILYLPIDDNKKPNWEFMEKYIKSLPYSEYL